ncbi:acyl-CoA dehydrogenase family protein [Actinoplanes sp. NPDC049316]|uniref:acyl-CoA dehydrogenase family protein n=1 Tax=Actinoplanes sp. NPDC049316 TaxID=3154727 RepID=UPI00341F7784
MDEVLDRVREFAPGLRAAAAGIDRDGAVPQEIIDRLLEAGVFRLAAPAAHGGLEAEPSRLVAVFEELGRAEASTGWCAMIGAATGIALAYLPGEVAASMLADPRFLIAGVAAPMGRATAVDGGYRLTGRWAFASACRHATWLVAGALTPDGVRMCVLDAGSVTIHDTWQAFGLRGTGSHDFSVEDVFVPRDHTFSLAGPPSDRGALYRLPPASLLSLGIPAVALGMARAAIEDFGELARTKRDGATGEFVASRATVRTATAQAQALYRSGRAYLLDEITTGGADVERRAAQRLAIATATRFAAQAVDVVYEAAGGSAVYQSSPLQRHFRDVHAAAQHAMVSSSVVETAGAVLLGQDVDVRRL